MLGRIVSAIMFTLLLTSMLALAFNIQPVRAIETIYIRADGSIDPPTAPIQRDGDVFTLTSDLASETSGIVVERDNTVLDGGGRRIQGTGGSYMDAGIIVFQRLNVSIRNVEVETFEDGICLVLSNYSSVQNCSLLSNREWGVYNGHSIGNNIVGNKIVGSGHSGIWQAYTTESVISENHVENSSYVGIIIDGYNCNVSRNEIVNNGYGISGGNAANYSILENNMTGNNYAIRSVYLDSYHYFSRAHNNFINNTNLVYSHETWMNVWDDGYPYGGNYWSDYNGTDFYCGPYQNETGSDGIGDTTYTIDSNNVDNYPLMRPYAQFDNQTIYIRADGSVDPSGAPIQRQGDLYILTGNITSDTDGIVIERDSIVIDGAGYTVTGSGSGNGTRLTGRSNVTVGNMTISNFFEGILLECPSNGITLSDNNLTANIEGICLQYSSNNPLEYCSSNVLSGNNVTGNIGPGISLIYSSNNTLSGNNVANTFPGIFLGCSSNNTLSDNNVANNNYGIEIYYSDSNVLSGNNVTANNGYGIELYSSSNNSVFHNSFVNNTNQVWNENSATIWDDGYPSGGNYWSDYSGIDLHEGVYQNETGSDGIGDTPYVIDENNRDHYPLMNPWNIQPDIAVMNVSSFKTVIGLGYCLNMSVTAANQGDYPEAFNVTVYANGTQIEKQPVTLGNGTSTAMTFTWNATGFVYGNYTLSAYAWPVLGEIDVADNNYTCGIPVHIGVPGDVSGPTQGVYDQTVNMRDVQYLILLFNTYPSSPNWKPNADINNDGTVNMRDIQIAILNFNQHE